MKRIYGTEYGQPGKFLGHISNLPGWYFKNLHKFHQYITINPLTEKQNFKYRTRIWYWNQHVPASNTGGDFVSRILVDYDGTGNIWEYEYTTDRITSYFDYKPIVDTWIELCDKEFKEGQLTEYEYYEKLYSLEIHATIWLETKERIITIYPDDLYSLHTQKIEGALGHDRTDIQMNIIFPKLASVSNDIFIYYDHVEDKLFKNCDRLTHLPKDIFKTLINQKTLDSWFENSGIMDLDEHLFDYMPGVISARSMFKNSSIRRFEENQFKNQDRLINWESFASGSNLLYLPNNLVSHRLGGYDKDLNLEFMFANCLYLNYDLDRKFKNIFNLNNKPLLHTNGMLLNVNVYNSDEEILEGLYWDQKPTLANYIIKSSTDTTGLEELKLVYNIQEEADISSVKLIKALNKDHIEVLTNTSQLSERIVIEVNGYKVGYDPKIKPISIADINIVDWNLKPGRTINISIYSKSKSDLIGIQFNSINQQGEESSYLLQDKISLEIYGSIPFSNKITRFYHLFNQLRFIRSTDTFFKNYTQYNVENMFADLKYFNSLDYKLLRPLTDQVSFKGLVLNNKAIDSLNTVFSKNTKVSNLESAFENCTNLKIIDRRILLPLTELTNAKNIFKMCYNLAITDFQDDLFKNNIKIETLESAFERCILLTHKPRLDNLLICSNFKRMFYMCEKLEYKNLDLKEVNWDSDDEITKFGTLKPWKLLPKFDESITEVFLDEMFFNCQNFEVHRHLLDGEFSNIKFNINNMFKDCKSLFSDKFIFKSLVISGSSGINIYVPQIKYRVKVNNSEVRLSHILRVFGITKPKNSVMDMVSIDNSIFYPEYSGNIRIDWGDGKIEDITLNPTSKFRGSSIIQASRLYYKEGSGFDGDINYEDIDIELYPKTMNHISHVYGESFIGKEIEITIDNRFIPLSVSFGGNIIEVGGELPWSRIELLDLSSWKNIERIPESIFNNIYLSTNTGLRNYSTDLTHDTISYSVFNDFKKLKTVEDGLFKNFKHLTVLGPMFTNCSLLYELPSQLFTSMKNVLMCEYTFFGCTNLQIAAMLPESSKLIYATHAYTSIMTGLYSTVGELSNLIRACHVMAGSRCKEGTFAYAPFAQANNITKLMYIFRNVDVINLPNYIFNTLFKLEKAIGVFSNTPIEKMEFNPFPETPNLTHVNQLFEGSLLTSYNNYIGKGNLTNADKMFKDCVNLKFVKNDIFASNTKLVSINSLFEGCKSITVEQPILSGLPNLKFVDNMYKSTMLLNLSEDYFIANKNIISAQGLLSNTPTAEIPLNIFKHMTRLEHIDRLFEDCKELTEINHLGLLVPMYDEGLTITYMFRGCDKLKFGKNKLTNLITPKVENSMPLVNIHGFLYNIEAKLSDAELADDKFTLIGLSQSLYRPDASTDVYNMNKFTFKFSLSQEYNLKFKYWDYNGVKAQMSTITKIGQLTKSNRIVLDIDGVKYGYDKRVNADALLYNKALSVGSHIISIYTEGANDIENDDTINSDLVILDLPVDTNIELSGNIPIGPQDTEKLTRKYIFTNIFKGHAGEIDIYNCNFRTTNGNKTYLSRGFFRNSTISRVNLSNLPLIRSECESMFEGCTKLVTVEYTSEIDFKSDEPIKASNFFKGCSKLVNLPNKSISDMFVSVKKLATKYTIQLPIDFTSMFEGCSSLKSINKVIDFSWKINTIEYSLTSDITSTYINLRNMFKGCSSLSEIPSEVILDNTNKFPNTYPTYIFTSMFDSCGSITTLKANLVRVSYLSNGSEFTKMFYNCINLTDLYKPLIHLNFKEVYMEKGSNLELGYMFGQSTKLAWQRTKWRNVMKFSDPLGIPGGFNTYGMLENIISYLHDKDIFSGFNFYGATLAIFEDHGPTTEGMNKLTMWWDLKRQYEGQSWSFRLWGPTTTDSGYQDVTNLKSTLLNGKVVLIFNDVNTSDDAFEYSAEEPTTIITHRVPEPEEPYVDLPDADGLKVIRVKIDVYTDQKVQDFEIHEFMGTMRPSNIKDVVALRLEGSLGKSEKLSSKGLWLKDIFGEDSKEYLISIGSDLLKQNENITPQIINDGTRDYYYKVFKDYKNIKEIPTGLLDHLTENVTEIKGLFADTSFDIIPENLFDNLSSITDVSDLFANSKLPNIKSSMFDGLVNVINMNGVFYNSTGLEGFDVSELLEKLTKLKYLDYGFANTDLNSLHVDMFRFNNELATLQYVLQNTNINSIPNIFTYNSKLTSLIGAFKNTKITRLPEELFKDKNTLEYIDEICMGCSNLSQIGTTTFQNCTNIISAKDAFNGCSVLHNITKNIFESFTNVKHIDGIFEGCSNIDRIDPELLPIFSNVETASRIYKNATRIAILHDNSFKTWTKCTTLSQAFMGRGSLGYIGKDLFNETNKIIDISDMFNGQFNITEIPEHIFDNLKDLENVSGLFESLTGLRSINKDIFKFNTKINNISRIFKQTALRELPTNIFTNKPISNVSEMCYNCGNLKLVGKPFITLTPEISSFNFKKAFYNCISFNLHYNKIDVYLDKTSELVSPREILVSDMFVGVKTFFDEETVWKGVNKVGDSKLTHTPPPSTNIEGLNELTFKLKPSSMIKLNQKYKLIDLRNQKVVENSSSFFDRVVIVVNGKKRAYENLVFENEPVEDIMLDDINTEQIVSIYTKSQEDLLYLSNMWIEDLESSNTDLPTLELSGKLNSKINSGPTDYKLSNMTLLFNDSEPSSDNVFKPYRITSISETLLSEAKALPRLNNEQSGFLSDLDIELIPSSIFKNEIISRGSNIEFTVGLFANCKKLKSVPRGIFNKFIHTRDLSYVFYNCISCTQIPALVPTDNMVNKLNYFVANTNLDEINQDLLKNLYGNIDLVGAFSGIKSNGEVNISDELFNPLVTYKNMDYIFYRTGIKKIPASLKTALEFITSIRHGFEYSKIEFIPSDLFSSCKYMSCNDNETDKSPLAYTFANISTLVDIEGRLNLNSSVKSLYGLFARSINLNWKNHLVSRFIYRYSPETVNIGKSFEDIHINWENDTQLFRPITTIGESNAIFDGRLIPPTDPTSLNELIITIDGTNLEEDLPIPLYFWSNINGLLTEPLDHYECLEIIASTDLKGRLVVILTELDNTTELFKIGYDKEVEESIIEKVIIPHDRKVNLHIYTEKDYVSIKGTPFKSIELKGKLPVEAYNTFNTVQLIDIYQMFGSSKDDTNITLLGSNLLENIPISKELDLTNKPFQLFTLTTIEEGFFDILVDQRHLDYQFEGLSHLKTIPPNLLFNLTKLESTKYLFSECSSLDLNLETFFSKNTKLNNISGVFNKSGITKIHPNTFKNNINLRIAMDIFAYSKITSIPNELFKVNTLLLNIAGAFRNTKITSIPELFLNPGCYELGRLFFSCTSVTPPLNKTLVEVLYNSNPPVDSVSLLDCFWEVPVQFDNEGQFVDGIRFMTGATGARFMGKN